MIACPRVRCVGDKMQVQLFMFRVERRKYKKFNSIQTAGLKNIHPRCPKVYCALFHHHIVSKLQSIRTNIRYSRNLHLASTRIQHPIHQHRISPWLDDFLGKTPSLQGQPGMYFTTITQVKSQASIIMWIFHMDCKQTLINNKLVAALASNPPFYSYRRVPPSS